MKFDLQVARKPFAGLLKEHKPMEIPPFQRPYAWKLEHWAELWEDTINHIGQDYLMGGIVLCGGENGNDLVIDGQQRIVTITLLIAVCRDYLFRECNNDKAKKAIDELHREFIVCGGVIASTNEPFISLGDLERKWFAETIQVSPDDASYSPPDLNKVRYGHSSSIRLLWKAYQYFYRQLIRRHATMSTEKKVEDVICITNELTQHFWFVITRVPDDTQAYTLFEVLNDRGLELSIADLFKNKILSHASEVGRLQRVKEYWAEIIDSLGYENIPSFLRYYWISSHGKKTTENDLFPKFKEDVKQMAGNDLVTFLKSLSEESKNFAEILGLSKQDDRIARETKLIKSYGIKVGNPVLLAVWATSTDEKVRLAALRDVKKFVVKYAIFANQVTNDLENIMAEIAIAIREDTTRGLKEMDSRFKKALPNQKVIREGFLGLEPSVSVARGLLIEIETHLTGTEKTISGPDEVNVEHIFPQSPSAEWIRSFGAGDEEETYCSRLGNLTLIDAKLNKQASNKSYKQKRDEYYSKSDFHITKNLPSTTSWTAESVRDRQAKLYDLACQIWTID